jgi:hypothetical protein
MATEHDVLDRLERMLAAATMGPWETDDVVVPPSKLAMERTPFMDAQVAHLIRTTWIHGQAKAKLRIVKQWHSPYTEPNDWHSFEQPDAKLIVALRNSAPALIRLARAAVAAEDELRFAAKLRFKTEDEIREAAKALAEVRL